MKPSIVVLASGSGTLLQALLDDPVGAHVVGVGSDVATAPALARAQQRGITTFICDPGDFDDRAAWNAQLRDELTELNPDLIVSAGFMRIIGPSVLRAFPQRIINTHPAYLPEFPGAHAVRDALAAGVSQTGCTVHIVDEGVDTGPVLVQERIDVLPDDDEVRLHERIKVVERRLLISTVAQLIEAMRKDGARE